MKITTHQSIFAILQLTMEMAANQKAFHRVLLSNLASNENEVSETMAYISEVAKEELDLIRAEALQYSEIDPNDLWEGKFDV